MNKIMLLVIVAFLQACALRADVLEDAIQNNDLWQVKKYVQERSFTSAEKSYLKACAQKNVLKAKPTMEPRFNLGDGAVLLLAIGMTGLGMFGIVTLGAALADDISNSKRMVRPNRDGIAGKVSMVIEDGQSTIQGASKHFDLSEFFSRITRPGCLLPYIVVPIASAISLSSGLALLKKYFQGYYSHQPYIKALAIETLINTIQAKN